ncbi:MAG: hypothetical protein ACKOEZ_02780, partial [Spartobacteria bacterium]
LFIIESVQIAGQKLEFREEIQLQIFWQRSHLSGADSIEDHLKHNRTLPASSPFLASRDFSCFVAKSSAICINSALHPI